MAFEVFKAPPKRHWRPEEDAAVLARKEPDAQLAENLGRSEGGNRESACASSQEAAREKGKARWRARVAISLPRANFTSAFSKRKERL